MSLYSTIHARIVTALGVVARLYIGKLERHVETLTVAPKVAWPGMATLVSV